METSTRRSEESAQLKGGVLRRSTILALIIGSALTWVNQSAAIFGSDTIQILPLLTCLVSSDHQSLEDGRVRARC